MNIHEILKDSKGFPDDLSVPITSPDGDVVEVPLKELRAKFRAADADYTRKAQELASQVRQFEDQKLKWAAEAQARPEPAALQNPVQDRPDDLEEFFKPVYEKVYTKYDPALKTIETLQAELKRRDAEMINTMTIYADREIRRMYDALPDKPTTDDGRIMDAKEFGRYAMNRGYVDAQGFPDFERASNDYFGPSRIEKKLKDAREQGRKEALEETRRDAFMPKPNIRKSISMDADQKATARKVSAPAESPVPGINRFERAPQKTNKSRGIFSEALNEALNDPDIREGLYNLNNRA